MAMLTGGAALASGTGTVAAGAGAAEAGAGAAEGGAFADLAAEAVPQLPVSAVSGADAASLTAPIAEEGAFADLAATQVPQMPISGPSGADLASLKAAPVGAAGLELAKQGLSGYNTLKGLAGGTAGGIDMGKALGTLGSLYSGADAASAISQAGDAMQKSITTAQGQLLTSKTEALAALANGLIDQKTAIAHGLVDANGALTQSSQAALANIAGGAATARGDLTAAMSPYTEAGKAALQSLTAGLADGGEFRHTFTMADAQNTPAMQFAQQQGMDVIQNSAAARGGLLGTNALKQLNQFGQANAAQYEDQAFRQYLANRGANQAGLERAASAGQGAAGTLGTGLANIATGAANQSANINQSTGQHISANDINAANATANAIGNNGTNIANLATGYGKSLSGLTTDSGGAAAKTIVDQTTARNAGLTNSIKSGVGSGIFDAAGNWIANKIGSTPDTKVAYPMLGPPSELAGLPTTDNMGPPEPVGPFPEELPEELPFLQSA